jgi:biopolymer transport protein ExbB/TolQ
MFEGKSFFDILALGGFTLYVLLFISCVYIAIIVLKIVEFHKKKIDIDVFFKKLKLKLERQTINDAITYCQMQNAPVANVVKEGLLFFQKNKSSNIKDSVERTISVEVMNLEKYISIIATIGGIAVYIGLFGTVLGIIRSFHDISLAGSGGISVVIGGVSESLVATAAGLCVAIPAVVAYNFIVRVIDNFTVEMQYAGSLLKDILSSGSQENEK